MTLISLVSIKSAQKEDTKTFSSKMVFFLKEKDFVFPKGHYKNLLLERYMREVLWHTLATHTQICT